MRQTGDEEEGNVEEPGEDDEGANIEELEVEEEGEEKV